MSVTKAVVPVAGLGTRLLPATKSQPKEMLPVGRKPVVQYVIEEIEQAGLRSVLFVTGRNKTAIEDHFDRNSELRRTLANGKKSDLLAALAYEDANVEFLYIRQSEQLELGHAVSLAEGYAEGQPFAIALGNSIIESKQSPTVLRRLIDAFERAGASAAIAFEEVEPDDVVHYGIADPADTLPGFGGDVFRLRGLVEKPAVAEAPSRYAIAGRYVVSSAVFDALRRTQPGKGGEIQTHRCVPHPARRRQDPHRPARSCRRVPPRHRQLRELLPQLPPLRARRPRPRGRVAEGPRQGDARAVVRDLRRGSALG